MARTNKAVNKVSSQSGQGSRLRDLDIADVEKLFHLGLVPGFNTKGRIVPSESMFILGTFRERLSNRISRFFIPIVEDGQIKVREDQVNNSSIALHTYKLNEDLYSERQNCVLKAGSVVHHLSWKMSNFPYIITDQNCNMIASGFESVAAPTNVNFTHSDLGEVTIAHCYEALKYFKGITSCKK